MKFIRGILQNFINFLKLCSPTFHRSFSDIWYFRIHAKAEKQGDNYPFPFDPTLGYIFTIPICSWKLNCYCLYLFEDTNYFTTQKKPDAVADEMKSTWFFPQLNLVCFLWCYYICNWGNGTTKGRCHFLSPPLIYELLLLKHNISMLTSFNFSLYLCLHKNSESDVIYWAKNRLMNCLVFRKKRQCGTMVIK